MLDVPFQDAPVVKGDRDVRLIVTHALIRRHVDFHPHGDDRRIHRDRIGELARRRLAVQQPDGRGMVDAELARRGTTSSSSRKKLLHADDLRQRDADGVLNGRGGEP